MLVEKIRDKELRILVRMSVMQTIISFFFGASSFLIATASFIAYIYIDENNNLDASTAFVSLTLFNMIRFPLLMLQQVITAIIQVDITIKQK